MSNTYLAVFLGSKSNPKWAAWGAMSEAERNAKSSEGITAWKAWVEKNKAAIVEMGGPLGSTLKVSASGAAAVSNDMGAYCVVRAETHEPAAKLFENHPHFMIFPGESIEVMPVMPIPPG